VIKGDLELKERTKLLLIFLTFACAYYIPWDHPTIRQSGLEAFMMLQEYAREHVLTCLIPAFFIAGAIAVFVSQASVLKYFGATANKILAYSVASVSGTVLAVCSCTVLPLFAGIYMRGGGIGPATAFLYSGPAINVLAIVLTARILGWQLGLARAIGAVLFSVIVGLLMAFVFRKDDAQRTAGQIYLPEEGEKGRTLVQDALFMLTLVLILVFAAFARPAAGESGLWSLIFSVKWYITAGLLVILGVMLKGWFKKEERLNWVQSTWGFMKQIFPLLAGGVLVAGFLLGRPGYPALIPEHYGRRKFSLGKSFCIRRRGTHVFCHSDGSAYPARAHWFRHGTRPRPFVASCRPGPFPSQHGGPCGDHGGKKDLCLLRYHRGSVHHCGDDFRVHRWIGNSINERCRCITDKGGRIHSRYCRAQIRFERDGRGVG
jgi:uncharacterized membrane protein YraQ (UPF0718 family)